jgi:Ca-activated chloride channel family protein
VTTTTVGLGRNFNEELMIGMARAGGGQHYYGQTAEDLHDSFDEELSLLQSLYLRRLRVKLVPAAGVVAEPLGLVRDQGGGWHALSDLAWGSEAWMLVRLHLIPVTGADPRQLQALLAVVVEGVLESDKRSVQLNGMLSLPRLADTDVRGLLQDELVARRLKEVDFADATVKVHALAARGDMKGAQAVLSALESQVADHPWLAEKVASLQALAERDAVMSVKEMRYSMYRTAQRLSSKDEAQYGGSETDSFEVPAFLRRKASEGEGRKK